MPRKKTSKKVNKSKLESLSQSHGKTEKSEPKTLDQIWGDDGVWKYNTMSLEEYEHQLSDYNMTDLQRHASKVGIIPIESRARLQDTLLKEFKKHVSSYNVPNDAAQQESSDLTDEVQKILKEGR
jgi:2-hydroxychromene-2-carboxylate isomerase